MDSDVVEEILAHYGVRGMKWGVRRKRTSSGSYELSEDYKTAAAARSKPAAALSNQEMQQLITRMNLEQQYVRLITPTMKTTKMASVKKFVVNLLLDVGKEQVTRVARAQGMKSTNQLAGTKLKLDIKEELGKNKKKK